MHDVAIIGAGLVGCSTAYALLEHDPGLDIVILEKEYHLGQHQSGRNSGVLQPGYGAGLSERESTVRTEGVERASAFCRQHDIQLQQSGATIVATTDQEAERLGKIEESASSAGISVERLDTTGIQEYEPHAAGTAGLFVPNERVVDSQQYLHELAKQCKNIGGILQKGTEVEQIDDTGSAVRLQTSVGTISAQTVLNSAGLHACRLANEFGLARDVSVVPFRCQYYELTPSSSELCRSLLYPTPNPSSPSPGVKFVRRPDGTVILGPTVSPALGYESYESIFDSPQIRQIASNAGFWKFLASAGTLRMAKQELSKTYRPTTFLEEARTLIPALDEEDLVKSFVAVALRLLTRDGEMASSELDVRTTDRTVHVLNPMSAGVTVSLPLGEHLAEHILERL
ncbi:FAD-dependent oxidoreductase [Natrialba sp. INN-245]|uniref:FAD-dependent oxidoreductase n=1 Tax=Natrialba sp. INN-245 TaxID=2690967 RepID=UPI001312A2FF|nr:FAD-dependent oxidoreductase [Natrialba sp. INN-245]MWV38496.1 FAD-dependent oxidoreductase [Natrialba sp. INN-245]